jgi:hypothetical protein
MRPKPKSSMNSLSSKGVMGSGCAEILALTGASGRAVADEKEVESNVTDA